MATRKDANGVVTITNLGEFWQYDADAPQAEDRRELLLNKPFHATAHDEHASHGPYDPKMYDMVLTLTPKVPKFLWIQTIYGDGRSVLPTDEVNVHRCTEAGIASASGLWRKLTSADLETL